MKAIDQTWEACRAGSIEIKVSPLRLNAWSVVFIILLMAAGAALFTLLWAEPGAYDWGRRAGSLLSLGGLLKLAGVCAAYLALDALMLYLALGCDRRALHWHFDAGAFGPYSNRPVRLGAYRLMLVAPAVLLGFLPAVFGLCTGHADCYVWGLWGIACSLFDLNLFLRLRPYRNCDHYQTTAKSYEGWVIVSDEPGDDRWMY